MKLVETKLKDAKFIVNIHNEYIKEFETKLVDKLWAVEEEYIFSK